MKTELRKVSEITPYEKNTKKHDKTQIANVAESIRQYGFVQPVVVDKDGVIVIGHCRVLAAKKLGMKEIPCVCVDDLTPEQVKALRIVDNKTNESEWDMDFLGDELEDIFDEINNFDFDLNLTMKDHSVDSQASRDEEFKERMKAGDEMEEDEEYQEFLAKFEAKKTTDDCYTPENVYDAVLEWVKEEYHLGEAQIIRPFYPGGNYTAEDYPDGCVVVDNPPFSIISEICEYFTNRGIKFFLFAPALTLLGVMRGEANYVGTGLAITYENGANVSTSFVTNMGQYKIMAAPDLYEKMDKANSENLRKLHRELPKYSYPPEVLTSSMLSYMAIHGTSLKLSEGDASFIRSLDAQKSEGKGLFGSGFLLSPEAAAEKTVAEKEAAKKAAEDKYGVDKDQSKIWPLSDREKQLSQSLSRKECLLNGKAKKRNSTKRF